MSCNPLIRLYRGYLRVTRFLPPVPRNLFTTLLFLCAAYLVSDTLIGHTGAENNSALVFVLSVMFISLLTNGYFYGLIASLVGAFCINYFFMFPYRAFSLSYSGYPVAMVSMTLISGVVCALTSRVKLQAVEAMKREQDTKALYELNAKLNEEKAAIQLEAARETIRGNILRAVSHDLRTPLTAISGAASVLLSSEEIAQSEKNLSLVQDIKSDADALIAMVENLLSITKIRDGTMPLNKQEEMLEEVAGDALLTIRRRFPDFPIALNLSEDILYLPMEPMLIKQVIVNLLEMPSATQGTGSTSSCTSSARMTGRWWRCATGGAASPRKSAAPYRADGSSLTTSPATRPGEWGSACPSVKASLRPMTVSSPLETIRRAGLCSASAFLWRRSKMNEKRVILVIEDEHTISNFICRALSANDYKPIPAFAGKEGLSLYFSHGPDLVLLDLGLPDMDGIEVLQELSGLPQETPVIIISARDRESEKVKALDMGADDYIVKPFGVPELLARIRTTLRRADRLKLSRGSQKDIYHIKDLTVDIAKHQVLLDGEEIHFTQNEFKILELLCIHAGKVLTYDFIQEHVWGPYGSSSNQILRVNMANIRRKLKENPSEPKYVLTELGIGYRMLED